MPEPLPPAPKPPLLPDTPWPVLVRVPVRWDEVGWGAVLVAGAVASLWFVVGVRPVSVPLLAALAIAYILNPAVDALTRLGMGRSTAIALLMFSFLAATALFGVAVGPQIVGEAQELPGKLRQVLSTLRPSIEQIFHVELPDSVDSIVAALQQQLATHERAPYAAVAQKLTQTLRVIFGGTISALASLAVFALVPLFTFYFLRDFGRLRAQVATLCPKRWQAPLGGLLREIDGMLGSFVRGQILVGLVLSVLYSVGFVVVGLPLALFVGIVTGLGNMLPFVGTVLGLLLSMLLCLLNWRGFMQPLLVGVVFVLNHALESYLITPRIVGTQVGLTPFSVILGVLAFGEMFGFVGILLAVPLTAVLNLTGQALGRRYRGSPFYQRPGA